MQYLTKGRKYDKPELELARYQGEGGKTLQTMLWLVICFLVLININGCSTAKRNYAMAPELAYCGKVNEGVTINNTVTCADGSIHKISSYASE